MQFAGSLVGALIAVIGALIVGYILSRHERLTQQRDQRQRILESLLADLDRNQDQLADDPEDSSKLKIESISVWAHSGWRRDLGGNKERDLTF